MRAKRLKLNTISSLLQQVTTLVCGFILPRLILNSYGSEVNGLVNSVTQFLGIISFFELGMGAVVQAALYKPLAENNDIEISKIISSAQRFFGLLAKALLAYVVILVFVYPCVGKSSFDWQYTALLILAMSISSFAQYYFGITNFILLNADQRGYIQFFLQTISVIINTAVCALLIYFGLGIQVVKLATSIVYFVRPVVLYLYVNKHYNIDRKIKYEKEPITQKWNGIAQHIAGYVLDSTDIIVLTLFSTLTNVSIYSVYHLVVVGIKQLLIATTNGIQSIIGEFWAKQKDSQLNDFFSLVEWSIHTVSTFLFGCTAVLIVPFVLVYTKDVNDANYNVPAFAFIITIAHMLHCYKTPYQIAVTACNHFKQTQKYFVIAAAINLSLSIIAVNIWGLVGIAIGTLIAMVFQTVWLAIYNHKNLFRWPLRNVIKQLSTDILIFTIGFFFSKLISMKELTFASWILFAIKTAILWAIITLTINLILYREKFKYFLGKLQNRKTT